MKNAVLMCAIAAVAGCNAGNVSGEIDGRTVSGLTSASFGGVEDIGDNKVFALVGMVAPVDSCGVGSDYVAATGDQIHADNVDQVDRALNDMADVINDNFARDDWYAFLTFVGLDIDEVREETYDVEDQERDNVDIVLTLCLQEDDAEVVTKDGRPALDDGAECFHVGEGELTFVLADDDSTLRVSSEDEVEMRFDDGDKAGDVTLDITFKGCEEIADATFDMFEG